MLFAQRFNIIFVFFMILGGVMGMINEIILSDPDPFIDPNVTNNSANMTDPYFDKINNTSRDVESTIEAKSDLAAAISEALGFADFTLFRVGISLLSGFLLPGSILRDALLPLAAKFAPAAGIGIATAAITTICTIIQVCCTFIQFRYAYYLVRKV